MLAGSILLKFRGRLGVGVTSGVGPVDFWVLVGAGVAFFLFSPSFCNRLKINLTLTKSWFLLWIGPLQIFWAFWFAWDEGWGGEGGQWNRRCC